MAISLEKRAEKVGIILAKHNITTVPPIRVGVALDISGSTSGMYSSGVIQETVDRVLGVAMKFDDNGELDMWVFDDHFSRLTTANANDYGGYVQRHILENRNIHKWGSTLYAPVAKDIVDYYFSGTGDKVVTKKSGGLFGMFQKTESTVIPGAPANNSPAMCIFITDGENFDEDKARKVFEQSSKHNMYWMLLGVGHCAFSFLKETADKYPNVGFVRMDSLNITDEQLYEQLVCEEFCNWVKRV